MAQKTPHNSNDFWRRRSRNNYVTATLSMGLVLLFLGVFVGVILFGQQLADRLRSKLEMKVFLHDGIGELQLQELEVQLRHHPAITSVRFISKDAAARLMLERTGEDVPLALDGVNPLPASYNLLITPQYMQFDSLTMLRADLEAKRPVSEVVYEGERLNQLNHNIQVLSWLVLGIGLILILVSFYLIFTTIRLNIFAKRLVIRSMELVGATRNFIRRPFLWQGAAQGLLSGLLASAGLTGFYQLSQDWLLKADLPKIEINQIGQIGLLSGIVLFGLLIGTLGSYLAVNRYLNRSLDELV